MEQVDRGSRVVLWRQIAERVARAIGDRKWTVGDRLPSEAELCLQFGVSRVTLRQALGELERRGLAHPRAGSGWYVGAAAAKVDAAAPLFEPPGLLVSFTQMAQSRGLFTDSVVLHCEVREADWDEATKLSIAPGARLLSLLRVRRLDGLPIAYDHSLVPAGLIGEVTSEQFVTGSLYDALRRNGATPSYADYQLEAVDADPEQAHYLDVEPGASLLSAREILMDTSSRPIELGHITYRGDRYQFRAVLYA